MPSSAVESLRYAFGPDLIALYVVVIVGRAVMAFAASFPVPIPFPVAEEFVRTAVTLPLSVLGFVVFAGGLVGILHRVVSDAR